MCRTQVIVDNMDALLDEPPFSAVAAMPYSSRLFNSGVFVFEPSVAVASSLATLSRATDTGLGGKPAAVRIRGAMEQRGTSHLSDQSVLNHFFKGRWRPLPYGYNAGKKIYMAKRELWNQIADESRRHPLCGPAQAVGRAVQPDEPARRAAPEQARRDAAL